MLLFSGCMDVGSTSSGMSEDRTMQLPQAKKNPAIAGFDYGGERGIRTLDTLLTYTPLAGARLQPLGQLSVFLKLLNNYYRGCQGPAPAPL